MNVKGFSGDTVIVRNGTYLLAAALDFKGKAITVNPEHGVDNCTLDSQQQTRVCHGDQIQDCQHGQQCCQTLQNRVLSLR